VSFKKKKHKQKQNAAVLAHTPNVSSSPGPTLVESQPRKTLKLDLGCGQNPKEGFEGVDLYGGKAKHIFNLFTFPWPFESDSVDELHASHFLEHIPAREVENRDLVPGILVTDIARFLGQDMLFAFMDECYRIMKVDAWMQVIVPSGRSNRAFWDPTHRRFFMQETFLYFSAEWRKLNSLDHYRAKCNFGVDITHSLPQEETLRSAEAQAQRFQNYWNVTVDWIAKLKKLPAA
jgi:hypothetical protein